MLLSLMGMVAIIAILIFFNALYVAGEFAAVSARKARIEQSASTGNILAKRLLPIVQDSHKLDNYIAASQVGITISSVVLGIYGQNQIAPLLSPVLAGTPLLEEAAAAGIAATLVLLLLTTLQVILGELVPKSVAIQYPERLAMLTVIPMRLSSDVILKPLIVVLNGSGALLMRVLGISHGGGHAHVHAPQEIQYLIEQSHEGGLLDAEEHTLLDNAFHFGTLRVGEIVVPRNRMVVASVETALSDLLALAAEADYTRIPLYEGDVDHIVGFVHLKELFQMYYADPTDDVRQIMRPVVFVTSSNRLDEVWTLLNEQNSYLAIVIDEYGGTRGMVTREDLLEELFGEVDDEFDIAAQPTIRHLKGRFYRIRGDTPISLVNARLHLSLPDDRATTISGLIVSELGHLPREGEEVTLGGVCLRIHSTTERAIEAVTLIMPEQEQPDAQ